MTEPLAYEKFIKLMMMTQSPVDAEALSALRKANAYMASLNMNWEEFLRKRGTAKPTQKRTPGPRGDEEIEEMIAHLASTTRGTSFGEFVASIRDWWDEHGRLSERQYEAIRNAYERDKTRARR